MTIDEAISKAREKSDPNSACWVHCTSIIDCKKCEKEHEQIADWLEELKMYRESSYGELYGMVYSKAIDDFMKKSEYLLCENLIYQEMEDIAGRLKAGVDNDD